jgi:hypothetical protein
MSTLMEEVDARMAEARRDTFEFKRDVIVGAENALTGKTDSDKVMR